MSENAILVSTESRPATREEMARGLLAELPQLQRRALQLCRNRSQAEDLVQEVMVRALEKAHLWTVGTDLRAWLRAIMRNRYFSDLRLQRRRYTEPLDNALRIAGTRPGQDVWIELDTLRAGLDTMPPENRDLLLRISVHGEPYLKAAARSGLPLGTVRSRVHRARAHLQAVMDSRAH